MRIECSTVEDFLENLRASLDDKGSLLADKVYLGNVYVDVSRRPLGSDPVSAVKFKVMLRASCVVRERDGEYLLVMVVDCGADYEDSTQERLGSAKAREFRDGLQSFCKDFGLRLLPGSVSE